jgi:hypothetical protein
MTAMSAPNALGSPWRRALSYFRMLPDYTGIPARFLASPITASGEEIDERDFMTPATYAGPAPASVTIRHPGPAYDIVFGAFDMLVVSERTGTLLEIGLSAPVQRLPILIEDRGGYEILVITSAIPCFDHSNSLATYSTPADGRPDKGRQLQMVVRMRIIAEMARGTDIFRLAEWPIAVICSDRVRSAFHENGISGAVFAPV